MGKYIDVDDLLKCKFKNPISYNAFVNLVTRQSAVEVVRCKDCKHKYVPDDMEDKWCYWVDTDEDDFCSMGERKETEDAKVH